MFSQKTPDKENIHDIMSQVTKVTRNLTLSGMENYH